MEDRRAAYPTKDTPDMPPDAGRSAIDSPVMRAENDSIHNVHRRYWMLLVIGVVCVGLYSFYAPVSMTSALHCANGQNVSFSYLILEEDCISAAALRSTLSGRAGSSLQHAVSAAWPGPPAGSGAMPLPRRPLADGGACLSARRKTGQKARGAGT